MNAKFKVCIYIKGREKPIILTDAVTSEVPYTETIKMFEELLYSAMKGENKLYTFDFCNDTIVINSKDVDTVVISKPMIDSLTLVETDEPSEPTEGMTEANPQPTLLMPKAEEPTSEDVSDEDVFNKDETVIDVVEG